MAQEGDGAPSVEYSSTSIHPRPPTVRVASHRRALSFALLSLSGSRWHITADWAHRKTVAKPVKPRPAPTQPTTSDYVDEHWAITNERATRKATDMLCRRHHSRTQAARTADYSIFGAFLLKGTSYFCCGVGVRRWRSLHVCPQSSATDRRRIYT